MTNSVNFGLDPDCKMLHKFRDLDWVNGKNGVIFAIKRPYFINFGLHMDLDFKYLTLFGLWLDLDWVLKIQDWIRIAKYDSPLIFDSYTQACKITPCGNTIRQRQCGKQSRSGWPDCALCILPNNYKILPNYKKYITNNIDIILPIICRFFFH